MLGMGMGQHNGMEGHRDPCPGRATHPAQWDRGGGERWGPHGGSPSLTEALQQRRPALHLQHRGGPVAPLFPIPVLRLLMEPGTIRMLQQRDAQHRRRAAGGR